MPLKTYKYRIYPNSATQDKLQWTLDRCRELYNAALSERRDAWKYERKSITCYEQINDLPEIKHNLRPEYKDIAAHVQQDVLRRVDKTYQAFFARWKRGDTPGFPRFKGRDRYKSFTYPDTAGWKVSMVEQQEGNKGTFKATLHLSKIGESKVVMHRKIEGNIKTVTIKREIDHWYVVFSCEVAPSENLPVSSEDVGIDLGVSHLATLSNGEMIEHPRFLRKSKQKLEQAHTSVSRKKKGSHRRNKARKQLSKVYRKIRNQRKDFLHKESHKLVNRYQVLVFEDIKTGNLTKRPKPKQDEQGTYLPNGSAAKGGLNKSILDAGWGTFVSMCGYKAEEAGRTLLKVDPRFTSQICSGCGTVRKKDLSERWHRCDCGTELDRDVNAARNILARGYQTRQGGTRPTLATA